MIKNIIYYIVNEVNILGQAKVIQKAYISQNMHYKYKKQDMKKNKKVNDNFIKLTN